MLPSSKVQKHHALAQLKSGVSTRKVASSLGKSQS
jgi:hypothetical protein